MNDCKDLATKTCLLYTTSQEAFKRLLNMGLRYMKGRIVEYDPVLKEWDSYPKHLLLMEWYVQFGHDFKPSEIERELFPAVVAWFHESAEARIYE